MPLVQGGAKARWLFDRIAPCYDRINDVIYQEEWRNRVRREIRGLRVLDVGVGTGFTTRHLSDAVGIDLSREMLRRARYPGHLIRADFMQPPFPGAVFDTIVFAGSFYYLPNAERGAEIAAGLLRPGGRIVVLSPATRALSPFVTVYARRDYEDIATAADLRLTAYERLNWAACLAILEKSTS